MDPITQWLFIGIAFFLVFLNGFFVNAEFSIVKVRETRIRALVRKGDRRARVAHRVIQKMDEYLSATQLGITLASLGLGWIGEPAFAHLFEPWLQSAGFTSVALTHTIAASAAFVLITFLHIVLGELAPKSLAIQRPEGSALWTATPLVWFYRLSYPFIWALNGTAIFLLRRLGLTPTSEVELAHTEEELRLLLTHSQEHGALDWSKKRLLEQVFEFAQRSVRQVMVPSLEVKYLDTQKSVEENLGVARSERHTRYPLCDGSLDRVLGLVHVKDLFQNEQNLASAAALDSIKRPVYFVPENKGIQSLLADFRKNRIHMAVVVDEYGSTLGIATLEDILEELVGEIQDEFDLGSPPRMIRRTEEGHYLVHGRALLEQVQSELKIEIPDEENDTIAGHLMMLLGRTAEVGDEVVVSDVYRATVIGIKGFQITDIILRRLESGGRRGKNTPASPSAGKGSGGDAA